MFKVRVQVWQILKKLLCPFKGHHKSFDLQKFSPHFRELIKPSSLQLAAEAKLVQGFILYKSTFIIVSCIDQV